MLDVTYNVFILSHRSINWYINIKDNALLGYLNTDIEYQYYLDEPPIYAKELEMFNAICNFAVAQGLLKRTYKCNM